MPDEAALGCRRETAGFLIRVVSIVCVAAAVVGSQPARAATVRAPDIEQRVGWSGPALYCTPAAEWPRPDAKAVADIPARRVFLRGDVCELVRGPVVLSSDYADAVQTVFHELAHVDWRNGDEAATECFSLFVFRTLARRSFGASRGDADTLYRLAWQRHLLLPADYQRGCTFLPRDPLAALNGLGENRRAARLDRPPKPRIV